MLICWSNLLLPVQFYGTDLWSGVHRVASTMIACKRASIGLLFLSSLSGVLPTGHKVDIVVDLATKHPVSDKLWGVFFEEVFYSFVEKQAANRELTF